MKAREIMTRELRTISSGASITEAARTMAQEDVGALPVVDDGRLVGMVTDRDLVVRALAHDHSGSTPVADVMSPRPVTCTDNEGIADVLEIMSDEQIRRMPIVSHNGDLVGIVSLADLAGVKGETREVGEAIREICHAHGAHCQSVPA